MKKTRKHCRMTVPNGSKAAISDWRWVWREAERLVELAEVHVAIGDVSAVGPAMTALRVMAGVAAVYGRPLTSKEREAHRARVKADLIDLHACAMADGDLGAAAEALSLLWELDEQEAG